MEKKIILDLCGGSGAWSRPYKEAGYDVRVLTLPECDILDIKFVRDKEHSLILRSNEFIDPRDVYGILAAPPCTEFSIAKGNRSRDFSKAMTTVEACLQIIWHLQKYARLKFWALENPTGLLRRFLGKPAFSFEQWQFGGERVKRTDLWGYFNPPTPTHKEKPPCRTSRAGRTHAADWNGIDAPTEYAEYLAQYADYDTRRAASRAITPRGFAEAFFKANK
jgi:hypothetical protein